MVFKASIAAPPLNRIPFLAPLLIADKVAGVAEATNAHGLATVSSTIPR